MFNSSVSTVFINGSNTDYLLFKIAIHYAEEGTNTWFITPKSIQHFPQNLSIPNKEILKFILFLYLQTAEDLVTKLNSIQVWEKMPEVIIISDYQHYIMHKCGSDDYDSNLAVMAAHVTASLHDAALAVFRKTTIGTKQQKQNNKRTPHVFISSNYNAQSKRNQIIIKSLINLFFKLVLNTHNQTCEDSFNELMALLE